MRTAHLITAALLGSLLLLAACGDDDSAADPTTTPGANGAPTPDIDPDQENDLAQSLVLTINEFPSGWTASPPVDDDDDGFDDRCGRDGPAPGRTGVAESHDFNSGAFTEVSQSLALFVDESAARASVSEMDEFTECVVALFNAGEFDAEEVTFSDVTVSRMSFGTFGDGTDAYRVKALISATDGSGFSADMYMDIVTVSTGRVAFMILAIDLFAPMDTSALEEITERAVAMIQSAGVGAYGRE